MRGTVPISRYVHHDHSYCNIQLGSCIFNVKLITDIPQSQPGYPRVREKTLDIIREQYRQASMGVAARVDELRTSTGVTDIIADFWIAQMLERAQELQRNQITNQQTRDPRLHKKSKLTKVEKQTIRLALKKDIGHTVLEWVYSQPPESVAALPEDSCVHILFSG